MSARSEVKEINIVNGIPGAGDMTLFPFSSSGNTDHIGETLINTFVPFPGDAQGLIHRLYALTAETQEVVFIDTAIFTDLENQGRWEYRLSPIAKTGTRYMGIAIGREVQTGIPLLEQAFGFFTP